MKLKLRILSLHRSAPRRSRRQHLSNLIFILLGGLIAFNIKSFWYGTDLALQGYTDFSQFYAGATIIRNGLGQSLYTYETQEEIQKQLYSTAEHRTGPVLYYHPPFEILTFLPLTYTSYAKAYLGWLILNLIILLSVPLLLIRYLPNLRPIFSINVVISFFAFFPIFIAAYHGQDSLVLLLLFASAFIGVKRDRHFSAGILLGLGLFRFQIVAPFMLLFVIRKQWKVIQGFSVAALLVGVLSVLVTGWQGTIRYVTFLWEINQNLTDRAHQVRYALYPRAMANLRGLIYTLFSGHIADTVITVISVSFSVAVLVWFCVYLTRRFRLEANIDLEFSLGIAVILLAGIHVHLYDWSLLMLPILLLSNHYAALSVPSVLPLWTLRLAVSMLVITPVYVALIGLELTSMLVIPLLVLVVLMSIAISSSEHDRRPAAQVTLAV